MKNINWLDHIANLLVVVLGISIAFYLDEYQAEKNKKAQEAKYIEGLVADLEADLKALDTLIQVNTKIIAATNALAAASTGEAYEDLSVLRNDILFIQYNPPFVAQRTIYESMKASGKMDLITDFEVQNQLVELYEQYYKGTSQFDDALNEHLRDFIKPFFMERIRFTGKGVDDAFLDDLKFQNIIYSYRYLFWAKNNFYEQVRKQVDSVKVLVESQVQKQGT